MILPAEIILEVTNHCNLRCRFCHFHSSPVIPRARGFMSEGIWKKILNELKEWTEEGYRGTVCFHGAGEPLLHPNLREMLREARKIEGLSIGFMTNGMLLDADWSEFLTELPLDWLWFSVDGATPQINDYYRKGAKLEVIERNIGKLIELKERRNSRRPLIHFNLVRYPKVPEAEIEAYLKRWIGVSETVSISRFRPIGSRRILSIFQRIRLKRRPCPMLYNQMVIAWDGRVGLCCEDIFLEGCMGNVASNSMKEIYNNSRYIKMRKLHEKGKARTIRLCKDCDIWASGIELGRRELAVAGMRVLEIKKTEGTLYIKLTGDQ